MTRFAIGLALVALAYGGFGSPTPDAPGLVEAVVGLGLILACGLTRPVVALSGALIADPASRLTMRVGAACLMVLAGVPTLTGLVAGHQAALMLRDLLPLLFLFLPVLLMPGEPDRQRRLLALALALIGAAFALRHLWLVGLRISTADGANDGFLYLANSPAVPFAALAGGMLVLQPDGRAWQRLLGGAMGVIGVLVLLLTLQRAALAGVALGLAGMLALRLAGSARLAVLVPVIGGALLLLFAEPLAAALGLVVDKSRAVGSNARLAEAAVILSLAVADPWRFLLGAGWGAEFASPAVGGMRVGYTHGFATYLLFKAGLVGLVAGTLYVAALALAALRAMGAHPMLMLAAIPPVLGALTVYTSYKYLALGLLLALITRADPAPSSATR